MKVVHFNCDYCRGPGVNRASEYARKKRHFCKRQCYTNYRREILPMEEQNAWKGGITPEESRRRWARANKAKVAAMAKARRLRELNAPGSHTPEDWERVKATYNYECAEKDETCRGSITKDHEVPLIMGGSDNPENLRPLCRSHNARKGRRVHLDLMSTK
jgi:5-methylcytosine-specific restriction endonuclease McrA